MELFEFEKCFAPIWPSDKTDRAFRDWFMKHQGDYHGSYDILEKKNECLREIYKIWINSGRRATHFWILSDGTIETEDYNSENPDVSISSIKLSKDLVKIMYRDSTIKDILDEG